MRNIRRVESHCSRSKKRGHMEERKESSSQGHSFKLPNFSCLELQIVVSWHVGAGIELRSSGRAANALDC